METGEAFCCVATTLDDDKKTREKSFQWKMRVENEKDDLKEFPQLSLSLSFFSIYLSLSLLHKFTLGIDRDRFIGKISFN